jgi:hypothetical protein
MTAILLSTFPQLGNIEHPPAESIQPVFRRLMAHIDPKEIGRIAYWLYQQCPIEPAQPRMEIEEGEIDFRFFELGE